MVREEARAAAQLVHPHVTSVHDYGETVAPDGTITSFVVMELLNGEELEHRLTEGPLPWPEAVEMGAQVAEALAAAHRLGIVHRDITPANVMMTPPGVKVLDFGIATRIGAPDEDEDGETFGTPAYVAPERLDGAPAQPATDVYSLGVLLLRDADRPGRRTRRTPGSTRAPRWRDGRAAHARRPAGPAAPVARICLRCLARDPADRPTAQQVAAVLRDQLLPADAARPTTMPGAHAGRRRAAGPTSAGSRLGRPRPGLRVGAAAGSGWSPAPAGTAAGAGRRCDAGRRGIGCPSRCSRRRTAALRRAAGDHRCRPPTARPVRRPRRPSPSGPTATTVDRADPAASPPTPNPWATLTEPANRVDGLIERRAGRRRDPRRRRPRPAQRAAQPDRGGQLRPRRAGAAGGPAARKVAERRARAASPRRTPLQLDAASRAGREPGSDRGGHRGRSARRDPAPRGRRTGRGKRR